MDLCYSGEHARSLWDLPASYLAVHLLQFRDRLAHMEQSTKKMLSRHEALPNCRSQETGQEQEAHPLDEYFAELIR